MTNAEKIKKDEVYINIYQYTFIRMEDKTSTVEENEGKRCEETDSAQTKDAVKFLFIRKNEK